MTIPRVSVPVSPGGGSMVGCFLRVLALVAVMALGFAAAIAAGGFVPGINLVLRIGAGVGVAGVVAALVLVPLGVARVPVPVRGERGRS